MDHSAHAGRVSRTICSTVRRFLLAALLIPTILAWKPADAAAQTRSDSAAVLLATAIRFANEGRGEVAEALHNFILERFGDTPAAARVRELRVRSPVSSRPGRTELMVWGTMYGAWLGVAVPLIADADSPEPYGIGLLLGAPVGFFASRAYGRSRTITDGQARAITLGGTWGTWQGLGWAIALDIGTDTEQVCIPDLPCFDTETGNPIEERVTAAVVGGLAGILAGALISRKPISPGLASTVNFGALWGTWVGLAGGLIVDIEDDPDETNDDDQKLIWTLIGGNAGLLTTAILAPRWQLSRNRARLISLAGLIGGLAGGGIDLLVQPDDTDVAVAIPLATSLAGLVFGAYATRTFDDGSDGGPGGVLLDVRAGHLSLDVPAPLPTFVRDDRTGKSHPALHIPVLRARF
jgi:hypothetical protein